MKLGIGSKPHVTTSPVQADLIESKTVSATKYIKIRTIMLGVKFKELLQPLKSISGTQI